MTLAVVLATTVLPAAGGSDELECALLSHGALSVSYGELDFIGDGQWTYGFFNESTCVVLRIPPGLVAHPPIP